MSTIDTLKAIGRLRRSQPHNPDTKLVCDELELAFILLQSKGAGCKECEARRASGRERVRRHRERRC